MALIFTSILFYLLFLIVLSGYFSPVHLVLHLLNILTTISLRSSLQDSSNAWSPNTVGSFFLVQDDFCMVFIIFPKFLPCFPGVVSFFQVFQGEWEPCLIRLKNLFSDDSTFHDSQRPNTERLWLPGWKYEFPIPNKSCNHAWEKNNRMVVKWS